MILVAAKLVFKNEADRDKALAISIPIQMATRNEEDGCHDYCFAADPGVSHIIQVYERWETGQSLVNHFSHPNYLAMVDALGKCDLVESIHRAFDSQQNMPVYPEDGSPRVKYWDD
ncbi:MAG: antibiotic biosynthesis monooxygenase [Proteobacteria bacterium]|nr:antibiotic biosynthesis monooxygenase [Pseudomonadota bacterium]